MSNLKGQKGITLIALVITIIVLLILAGITIAQITGQDSAPEKATEAKVKNEQGAEFDAIKVAVVGAVANGNYGEVNAESLKNELNGLVEDEGRLAISSTNYPWIVKGVKSGRYYLIRQNGKVELIDGLVFVNENVKVKNGKTFENEIINTTGEEVNLSPESSNGITITKGENNKVIITATSDANVGTTATFTATAGDKTATCNVEVIADKIAIINSKIGKNVCYTVSLEGRTEPINKWKVFFADDYNDNDEDTGEVFIISENVFDRTGDKWGSKYTGSASFRTPFAQGQNLSYGLRYNKTWLDVCIGDESTLSNAKSIAQLCDSNNWQQYINNGQFIKQNKTENIPAGSYAVGGPTIELLRQSVWAYNGQPYRNLTYSANTRGYGTVLTGLTEPYLAKREGGTDFTYWWIASPSNSTNAYEYNLYVTGNGYASASYPNGYWIDYIGIRPLISIPLKDFNLDWINE